MVAVLLKAVIAMLGGLAATKGFVLAAEDAAGGPALLNVVLNFASLAILVGGVVFAPRVIRSRSLEAALKEKDEVIATKLQLAEARDAEIKAGRERLRDMGFQLDAAQHDASVWRGRWEEQKQYTAQAALEAIERLLEQSGVAQERRHREMMEALAKIPTA